MGRMATGMPRQSTKKGRRVLFILFAIGAVAGAVYFLPLIERTAPEVSIDLTGDAIGLRPFKVSIAERGRGLKAVTVELQAKGTTTQLHSEQPLEPVFDRDIEVTLDPKKLRKLEGAATLQVIAVDRSLWGLGKGNRTVIERPVTVDLTPPRLDVITRDHYVNFGGAGLVIYKTSPDTLSSGVAIGEYFFPGSPGQFSDPQVHMAFFAHPYDVAKEARPQVVAEDAAGNQRRIGFYYVFKDKQYRQRKINISDNFIERKVIPLLPGDTDPSDRVAAFLRVNDQMRRDNAQRIHEVCSNSVAKRLWQGTFRQLTNSKVEAQFADHRTYMYNGRAIDTAYHLGYDLAVTKRYPIEAANDGIITFAEDLGIYGNTVIVDHGLGVCSLYAHLSSIDVAVGDEVRKGQPVGRSGETGLAGGDHLHYGIYVRGVPVAPIEWWDPKWVREKVMDKIKAAESEFKAAS